MVRSAITITITITITKIDLVIVPCCESHVIAVNQPVHQPVPDDDDDPGHYDGDDDDNDDGGDHHHHVGCPWIGTRARVFLYQGPVWFK